MTSAILSLIIFAVCVVLFIRNKLPIAVTALLGVVAMILTGVISFSEGFKNFGSTTVVLICSMMVVGQATFEVGLAQLVGEKVMSWAKGNERMVIIIATALTAVVSAFLSNIATFSIMISILTGICAGNKKIHFMNVILPVSMASVIGGSATLIGSTPQLTAQGMLEEYLGVGNGFSFNTFIVPGGIIIVALVLYVGFIGYPLGKKIWGDRPEYNGTLSVMEDDMIQEGDAGKIKIMSVIFILTIAMFVCNDLIVKRIPNFNIAITSILSATACILSGCITPQKAIDSINWSLAIWFCASLGIAAGLSHSGGGELLAHWFIGLFGENATPFVLFIALVILVTTLTQFLSNSTVLAVILPVTFAITESMGYNSFSFAVGLTMGASMAVATPLANTTIGMSMVANYKFSDYLKYAGPMTVIGLGILLVMVPTLWPLA